MMWEMLDDRSLNGVETEILIQLSPNVTSIWFVWHTVAKGMNENDAMQDKGWCQTLHK